MKFTDDYIAMARASEEMQEMRKGGLLIGDYGYLKNLGGTFLTLDNKDKNRETWLPRTDQLLELLPCANMLQGGARRSLEAFALGCYFIPNKKRSYPDYNEYLLAYHMHSVHKKLWVPKLDKNGKSTGHNHWVNQTELLDAKLGVKTKGKVTKETEIRNVTECNENGKPVAIRTEKYRYDEKKGEVVVVKVLSTIPFTT